MSCPLPLLCFALLCFCLVTSMPKLKGARWHARAVVMDHRPFRSCIGPHIWGLLRWWAGWRTYMHATDLIKLLWRIYSACSLKCVSLGFYNFDCTHCRVPNKLLFLSLSRESKQCCHHILMILSCIYHSYRKSFYWRYFFNLISTGGFRNCQWKISKNREFTQMFGLKLPLV